MLLEGFYRWQFNINNITKMNSNHFSCPFCNSKATIQAQDIAASSLKLTINNVKGDHELISQFTICPNHECKQFILSVRLFKANYNRTSGMFKRGEFVKNWNLIPNSKAKVLPDYIPIPIMNDYNEACSILELSPKASATLSRRCLQGMIRDFYNVSKSRLIDEIEAIKDKVDPITWKSIDAVREIGNIGAHMEKDINTIIDVDPNEANLLLQLIEQLIHDWYINRHERELRHNEILKISQQKSDQKK